MLTYNDAIMPLGGLFVHGQPLDAKRLFPSGRRVPLPTYPWQRERFWNESEESRVSRLTAPVHPLLGVELGGPEPSWEARLDPRLARQI